MEEYRVRLSQFEGPLDLLLHLIAKAKIDLEDVFISQVTEQYLEYMDEIGSVDMERTSAFLAMASTLLFIKSRALLPRNAQAEDDGEDVEQRLIEQLRAYRAFKDVCARLREIEAEAAGTHYKLPEELPGLVAPVTWENAEVSMLHQAFLALLERRAARAPAYTAVEVRYDAYSVRAQTKIILSILQRKGSVTFFSLFDGRREPMEIAVTFLALLQLYNAGRVKVAQKQRFGDIELYGGEVA